MPVTNVTHDLETRTIAITAEFAAPVERIWQVYADPRQLEQLWRGRIARIDELIALDPEPHQE